MPYSGASGYISLAGTQLLDGAHHTVGLNAAEFALFDLDAARGHLAVMTASYTCRRPEQPEPYRPSLTFGAPVTI